MSNLKYSPSKFILSRLGRKLQILDEQRIVAALPKEIPERTWLEILQKEECDLGIFELREEIINEVLDICYHNYMEKQNAVFTAHCAAQAWLKLIKWQYYRHDPGEDPSAYPRCYIPGRIESWIPDKVPDPSPKDTWALQDLPADCTYSESVQKIPSLTKLEYPHVDLIPEQYWFPGKVNIKMEEKKESEVFSVLTSEEDESSGARSEQIGTESEILQKVTDYGVEEMSKTSSVCMLKSTSQVHGASQGAGDSQLRETSKPKLRKFLPSYEKRKSGSESRGRFSKQLPPLDTDSRSRISIISDCRLRNLRLDTQFEISSEKVETPPTDVGKKKWTK